MRYSDMFLPTGREVPSDAELISHQLMIRAGLIRKLTSGVYSYLPLGYRVIRKFEQIVREEMNRAGAQEVFLPMVQPAELWQESGRWVHYGKELLRFRDRHDRECCLGPTHEEVITDLVRNEIKSYRQLPCNLYQIQTKFRDEPRPRGGLVRTREFIMKDAYSFDRDEAGLNKVYERMHAAYLKIFQQCGLDITPVAASGGAIGGKETVEFMLLTDAGEDSILICPECGYAANQEIADFKTVSNTDTEASAAITTVATPDAHTVQQVCDFLNTIAEKLLKTLIYMADGKPVAALVRGDHELNEGRFRVLIGANTLEMATPEQILAATGGPVGFSGPVGLKIPIYADEELRGMKNFITGGNAVNTHLTNVNWENVTSEITWARLRFATAGDSCACCGTGFTVRRGMELGHIFKLAYSISEPLHAIFADEDGSDKTVIMGCYGIGVSRILAAVAEVSNDENGIIWPKSIAPYQVVLIVANTTNEEQLALGEKLYAQLQAAGIDVLFDDRTERAGVKFKDADLIGIPTQVVVGKLAGENKVEFRDRATKSSEVINADEVVGRV